MRARGLGVAALTLAVALLIPGTLSVWVDERGHTYLTDGTEPPVPGAVALDPEDLRLRWRGNAVGEALATDTSGSSDVDRYRRELRTAVEDLERGELRQGLERLRRLQRDHPSEPEPPWLIAQAERRRGRLESARQAAEALLSTASSADARWRTAAETLRAELDADLELASASGAAAFEELRTPHFRILYDHAFAGRDYGGRVSELLEEARERVQGSLGRALEEPLDVHLYTRGRYLEAYRHRFGFATVGFFDGAIHVVSVRHPREELFALLVHEYVHAVFRDAVGSDRPFFLNEGIADREEERARGRGQLAREEWRRLLDALRAQEWISLDSLVRGFTGVEGKRALLAYLEARAVVELVEAERPGAIAGFLERCSAGEAWETALARETGWDLERLEAALHADVRSRFPETPLARLSPEPAPSD